MSFCSTCGNLVQAIRKLDNGKVERFSSKCSKTPETIQVLAEDKDFFDKLKSVLRSGRNEKPLKSLARILNKEEAELHEVLKVMDKKSLPYGYYDKIDKIYVRTHLTEDIPEDLLLDLISKCYDYQIFGAKGLTDYISMGRETTIRKVIQALHEARKKEKVKGLKKGNRWLWRLPKPDEDPISAFFPPKKPKEEINKEDLEEEKEKHDQSEDFDEQQREFVNDDLAEDGGVYFADPEDDY